jgi:hypothetical protein
LIESLHALVRACDVDNEIVKLSDGSFASPDSESLKVTGIFQLLRKPGESLTEKQCFDDEIHHVAETTQPLLVLFDHKALREGAQSRVIIGSIVHLEISELVSNAVLVYHLFE